MTTWKDRFKFGLPRLAVAGHDLAMVWVCWQGLHYLRFAFSADPVRHLPDRALDDGIVQAVWLTPAELQAQADRHRSPLVWRVVQDYLAGRRSPLSTLQHIA